MSSEPSAVIVLQARTGSHRLPGKALRVIAGRPLAVHCLERLLAARMGPVVLATTTSRADDVLARLATETGASVVRGSETDVLGRFVAVAEQFPADVLLRATGDNPAVDIDSPTRVIRTLVDRSADYVVEADLPYGTAVEAIGRDALLRSHASAHDASDREHVTTWVKRHPDRFRVRAVAAPPALRRPELRFTVDTALDLAYVRRVMDAAGARSGVVSLSEIINVADRMVATPEVA